MRRHPPPAGNVGYLAFSRWAGAADIQEWLLHTPGMCFEGLRAANLASVRPPSRLSRLGRRRPPPLSGSLPPNFSEHTSLMWNRLWAGVAQENSYLQLTVLPTTQAGQAGGPKPNPGSRDVGGSVLPLLELLPVASQQPPRQAVKDGACQAHLPSPA